MFGQANTQGRGGMPGWVPEAARHYIVHTECGMSIRAIARSVARHPSTVLRQVRRWESLRDDPLIDEALNRLGRAVLRNPPRLKLKEPNDMTLQERPIAAIPDDETFEVEARRVLRRLCEPGAVLAVASEMDKAVVVRDMTGGGTTRTAVVERAVAQALAVKDWIVCVEPGRVARYRITPAGRAALGRMLAAQENAAQGAAQGFAEAQSGFDGPGIGPGIGQGTGGAVRGKPRFAPGDSPMAALARRRDRNGVAFLGADLVAAGERLREDFELAQMGPRVTSNWEHVLSGVIDGGRRGAGADAIGGSAAARARVEAALRDLGPGLGDVALRCCCHLEGLEQAEQAMGWSARSGKIVLRIALQRLKRHYAGLGDAAGMIG